MNKKKREETSSEEDVELHPEEKSSEKKAPEALPKLTLSEIKQKCWKIGKNKQIKFNEFKNKMYVDIREYYEENGVKKPGRKGISLSVEDFLSLAANFPQVSECVAFIKKSN